MLIIRKVEYVDLPPGKLAVKIGHCDGEVEVIEGRCFTNPRTGEDIVVGLSRDVRTLLGFELDFIKDLHMQIEDLKRYKKKGDLTMKIYLNLLISIAVLAVSIVNCYNAKIACDDLEALNNSLLESVLKGTHVEK